MANIPSHEKALGLIETRGLIGAIEAADAMVKAAKVSLHPTELSTGSMVTVKVTGEVGAVRSAVDAGALAAKKVGSLISTHIIPRPHDDTEGLIFPSLIPSGDDNPVDFSSLTVKELRAIARKTVDIGISGRQISTANRDSLIKLLENSQEKSFICRFPGADIKPEQ